MAEHIQVPKVTTDDYNSGAKAREHLIENGCMRIGFLSISQSLSTTNKRMTGYFDTLKNYNVGIDNSLIVDCPGKDGKDKNMIRKLLKRKKRPDGILLL